MNPLTSRRDFIKTASIVMGAATTGGGLLPAAWGEPAIVEPGTPTAPRFHYRAVSWWLTWDDLTWPNPGLMDKIKRRADQCVASEVNCCVVFGAHFRWDFLPLWDRVHDELRFVANELHQRKIRLFDHHSSVLTHRPRNREEAMNIWERNRHHVPFYPSMEEAARWQFNGSFLNDWRMIDVQTGKAVYAPKYNAEQYCMNNPVFRAAYAKYVEKLKAETGIDGLMSDDGIFYADWHACGCNYCRERFQREYGHDLPATSDVTFWGNRHSEAFKDWIAMRFKSSGEFLSVPKSVLPAGFPLLTCCSSSDGYFLPSVGMSYQGFIVNCNHIMLEMVGNTPSADGTWGDRIPSQLLHLGIASDYHVPCFGLGYAFFPDPAFFVWALNKFLGSDTWLSTLKGRLNATPAELAQLADDSELVGEGFRWEAAHPQLFEGELDSDVAVYFSRSTRDYFGQIAADYADDYSAGCLILMRGGVSYRVVTDIPGFGKTRCLLLNSTVCLSAQEKAALKQFLQAGGTIIATGPCGQYDERADPVQSTWLEEFGAPIALDDPQRAGGFPPYADYKNSLPVAQCKVPESVKKQMTDGWLKASSGNGQLLWRPERFSNHDTAESVVALVKARATPASWIRDLPASWQTRQYRNGEVWFIHALPAHIKTILHPTLKNHLRDEQIVEKLVFEPMDAELTLESKVALARVTLHSPDLESPREGKKMGSGQWAIDFRGVSRYWIIECAGA